jgi:hypothetical protein
MLGNLPLQLQRIGTRRSRRRQMQRAWIHVEEETRLHN